MSSNTTGPDAAQTMMEQWLALSISTLQEHQRAFVLDDRNMAHLTRGYIDGKTYAGIFKCLRILIEHPGTIVLFAEATVQPAQQHAERQVLELLPRLFVAKCELDNVRSDIVLVNGSILRFTYLAEGRRIDMLRGYVVDAVFLDNSEYLSYHDFQKLYHAARRGKDPAPHPRAFYVGGVEWRHWRELEVIQQEKTLFALDAGTFIDSE